MERDLGELSQFGYIEEGGGSGSVFNVTDLGFERAEQLKSEDPILSLSEEAKQPLVQGSKSSDGFIHYITSSGIVDILVSIRPIFTDKSPPVVANWIHALNELLNRNLIKEAEIESLYRVTKTGFEAAKQLDNK